MEGDLAANQPNPAARSAGATTSGADRGSEDSQGLPSIPSDDFQVYVETEAASATDRHPT